MLDDFAPVSVETHPGRYRTLWSVEDAAVFLLSGWPTEERHKKERQAALRACLAALEGMGSADAARGYFVDAATAAGVFVRNGEFPSKRAEAIGRTFSWIRAGDRYPDLRAEQDQFLALDGAVEVGVLKWIESGPDHGWLWSMTLVYPGLAFRLPTNGQCTTRAEAAHELVACWRAFRLYYGIEA